MVKVYDWKMEFYWRMPVFMQEIALDVYARGLQQRYYGGGYSEWNQRFKSWRSRSLAETEAWQYQQLTKLVSMAATKIPFYRETWRQVDWKAIKCLRQLNELPRLEKQSIRQNEGAFLVEGAVRRDLWCEKTSGTTGTSLKIYWPKEMLPKWWAIGEVAVRNVAGVGQQMPRAMLGGRPIIRGNTTRPPYWRFNQYWRQLYLSSYHVSRATAPAYVAALREYGSEWMTGYGSVIAALAEGALESGVPPLKMRAIIVSGDTLLPGMRSSIERFFQCKCYDQYGQCEGVALAMECPQGRMHVVPEVGIIEILREDGSPCERGEVGELVATGLLNDVMPLFRYRLKDYAAWDLDLVCPCGNPNPALTSLEGRVDDYLVTIDGRKIGRLSTAAKRSPTVHSAQIVQDRPGHAYLLIRPGEGYDRSDAMAIQADILERIGAFELEILEVPEIPKTPQGKAVLVIRLDERADMKPHYVGLLCHH